MSLPIKTQIEIIRKEALKIGYQKASLNAYIRIWNNYIKWKNTENFEFDSNEYDKFLFEYYSFDINNSDKFNRRHSEYICSKNMLNNFDEYKKVKQKEMFPRSLYKEYPNDWNITIDNFIKYSKEVKQNSESSLKQKKDYLKRELSYFYQKGLINLENLTKEYINTFINDTIYSGNISKRRNFYVLKEFLRYLFIEDVINEDLSVYIPKINKKRKIKLPTYLKPNEIEELLNIIPKERTIDKRNYAIILLAARFGLRISDILNIKIKDIDWQNNKFSVIQPKTNNLNILPLTNEVGWAIIDYIKVRPKCNNEYLFVKLKYPFERITRFINYYKYFSKADIKVTDNNKKGIHNLRHSLAKNMLDNDIPIDIIASTLGHSINTCSNTYLKIDIKDLKKTVLEMTK